MKGPSSHGIGRGRPAAFISPKSHAALTSPSRLRRPSGRCFSRECLNRRVHELPRTSIRNVSQPSEGRLGPVPASLVVDSAITNPINEDTMRRLFVIVCSLPRPQSRRTAPRAAGSSAGSRRACRAVPAASVNGTLVVARRSTMAGSATTGAASYSTGTTLVRSSSTLAARPDIDRFSPAFLGAACRSPSSAMPARRRTTVTGSRLGFSIRTTRRPRPALDGALTRDQERCADRRTGRRQQGRSLLQRADRASAPAQCRRRPAGGSPAAARSSRSRRIASASRGRRPISCRGTRSSCRPCPCLRAES